jgi:preprotein translocase SecE subunit
MFFWGIILMIAGALSALVTFLSNLDVFGAIKSLGFGPWVARFFAPENLTGQKVAFYLGIVLVIVGLVLFIVGKVRMAKNGEADKTSEKGIKFFRDLKGEFRKITWPTLAATSRNTAVTLAMCAIMGVIICLIDLGLGQLIKLLLG